MPETHGAGKLASWRAGASIDIPDGRALFLHARLIQRPGAGIKEADAVLEVAQETHVPLWAPKEN
jgi:hypothetical protein